MDVLKDFDPGKRPAEDSPDGDLERIRNGTYYPVGLERLRTSPDIHFVKTRDVYLLVKELMKRAKSSGEPVTLLVANPDSNFKADLSKGGEIDNDTIDKLARHRARKIGVMDMFLYEAIQEEVLSYPEIDVDSKRKIEDLTSLISTIEILERDYDSYTAASADLERLRTDKAEMKARLDAFVKSETEKMDIEFKTRQETYEKVPVTLLSELVDNLDFEIIYRRVLFLVQADNSFAEEVFACVPKNALPKEKRKKSYMEVKDSASKWMDYVIHQITTVLYLRGRKLGHSAEQKYDKLTLLAADKLGIPIDVRPQFETLELGDASGIPYRGKRADKGTSGELTMVGNWEETRMSDFEYREIQAGREVDDRTSKIYKTLIEQIVLVNRLTTKALAIVEKSSLGVAEKKEILELMVMHCTQEAILTLSYRAHFKFLFSELGILDLIKGDLTLEEWRGRSSVLPFKCPIVEGESYEAYFVRFAAELLKGGAFHGPAYGLTKFPNHMIEDALSKKVHSLAEKYGILGAGSKFDSKSECWTIPSCELKNKLFADTCGHTRVGMRNEIIQWELIQRIFLYFRENSCEGALEGFINDKAIPEVRFKNAAGLRECLKNNGFSEEFRAFLINCCSGGSN